jgi:hypothetical protein
MPRNKAGQVPQPISAAAKGKNRDQPQDPQPVNRQPEKLVLWLELFALQAFGVYRR